MFDSTAEQSLREIQLLVEKGKSLLFLGAGASHEANGPSGKALTLSVKEKFSNIDQGLNDLIEVCQDLLDTPPYTRNDLEEFVRSKLGSLQPTPAHMLLTKFDWPAIFTTNFDDLIELSYRVSTVRLKPCVPIYADSFQVNPSDKSKVPLFKLMGSLTALEGESGQMVLSRADYNKALIRRRRYLEHLSDFLKGGSTIFIGYSFGDRLVLDVIDELISIHGIDRLPWSYAIAPYSEVLDRKHQHMFSTRRIIPVNCNFSSFFTFLSRSLPSPTIQLTRNEVQIRVRSHTLTIPQGDARNYSEYFEILSEERVRQDAGDKDRFFMGTNFNWAVFGNKWDFERDVYIDPGYKRTCGERILTECMKDRVFKELRLTEVDHNKVLLLKGMAGAGKTMMARRLAWDVYTSGEALVIVLNPGRQNLDYKQVAAFLEQLNQDFNRQAGEGQHVAPLKLLIIIDDAAAMLRHVNRLKDYLTSRGRPVLILACERAADWELAWKSFPFHVAPENSFELEERLTPNEKGRIIEHFANLGYIGTQGSFWHEIIATDFENSFFATIYSLVHPSRKPLTAIIQNQYEGLTDQTKRAFRFICCFHQFNLPMNLELLVRSLKCTYQEFRDDVLDKDSAKVIFEDEDDLGNVYYRTHHRIIARRTVESFFGDPELQKEIFQEVFRQALITNRIERRLIEQLMVQHIGPNAQPQVFSHEQQRQLFRTLCEENQVRSLLHHWGVLETNDHKYDEAERLLKRALEVPRDEIESFRGESDQNILTSLGKLYSRMGLESERKGGDQQTDDYFQKAENCFRDARHGEFPNAYAYHSHAFMWLARGKEAQSGAERLQRFGNALEISALARDNLNSEELEIFYELETQIWAQIGNEDPYKGMHAPTPGEMRQYVRLLHLRSVSDGTVEGAAWGKRNPISKGCS